MLLVLCSTLSGPDATFSPTAFYCLLNTPDLQQVHQRKSLSLSCARSLSPPSLLPRIRSSCRRILPVAKRRSPNHSRRAPSVLSNGGAASLARQYCRLCNAAHTRNGFVLPRSDATEMPTTQRRSRERTSTVSSMFTASSRPTCFALGMLLYYEPCGVVLVKMSCSSWRQGDSGAWLSGRT